jgi:hypothetical protein
MGSEAKPWLAAKRPPVCWEAMDSQVKETPILRLPGLADEID